nr:MAG: hypothetical protein [Microvirus sp.]
MTSKAKFQKNYGQTSEPEMQNSSIGKSAQKRLDKPLLFLYTKNS